jgi:hypothetical protein
VARASLNGGRLADIVTEQRAVRTIIWVDPGKSTGWALWNTLGTFISGQDDAFNVECELHTVVSTAAHRLEIGWEQYLITGGRVKHDDGALLVIGYLEWITRYFNCAVLKPMPSSARNLGRDGSKLEILGWHVPGRRDANAAAAHLLAFLLREGLLPQETLHRLVSEGLDG